MEIAMLKTTFTLCMALLCASAIACLGPQSEDYVLLDALPASATKEAVIAKVFVTSRKDHEATVKVLEAIKGVKSGDVLTIYTSGSSCSWLDARSRFFQPSAADKITNSEASLVYYIAGDWKPDARQGNKMLFTGAWRGQTRIH
jgi:hypothetical protein